MKKVWLFLVLLCGMGSSVFGGPLGDAESWRLYLELDQMLVLKVGTEYRIDESWGIKGGMGVSIFSPTTVGYELLGVYHIKATETKFQWDLELGMPLAYFDIIEGNLVDWDPIIDDPYAGWAFGGSLVWGHRFEKGGVLSLKTGAMGVIEYQRDSGWKNIGFLPEVSLQWLF